MSQLFDHYAAPVTTDPGESKLPPPPDGPSTSRPRSAEYVSGFKDGLGRAPAHPGPLTGDALLDYQAGHREGTVQRSIEDRPDPLPKNHTAEDALEMLGPNIVARMCHPLGLVLEVVSRAVSPGTDEAQTFFVYQAMRMDDVPLPGAQYHRRREAAQRYADVYTQHTGEPTKIEQSNRKNSEI